MVKRYGYVFDADDNECYLQKKKNGVYVLYEDYQKLEEEMEKYKKAFYEVTSTKVRIDTTPPEEIVYPWGLRQEEKDG